MADAEAQRLRDFVDNIAVYTGILSTDGSSPKVVRKTNPTINKTTTFVASFYEPHDLLLPLNVIWIVYDSTSSRYKKVYRRDSKLEDTANGLNNTWIELTSYTELWDDQVWAVEDNTLPDTVPSDTATLGTVTLTTAPDDPEDPVVITEGDESLTNARPPLTHDEMHVEVPATRLATTGDAVVIDNGTPQQNYGMVANFLGNSDWTQLTNNHIYPSVGVYDSVNLQDPSALNLAPLSADFVFENQADEGTYLYGLPFNYAVSEGSSFDVIMPVWVEDGPVVFKGWFIPTEVLVISGIATVSDNTVTFTTAGQVKLQVSIVDVSSARTITVERTYLVEGS